MQPLLTMSGDSLPRAEEVALDSTVLLFALGLSLFTGILFGLLPAWQATRGELNNSLREGGRRSSGTGSIRLRGVLIISEVALALVLLVGAGLMIRSLSSLIQMDPGFDPNNLLTFRVSLPGSDYESQEQVTAFFDQLLADLNTLPEVESAGMVISMPPSGGWWINTFAIEGRPPAEPGQRTSTRYRPVSPDFFQMMRIPMVEGRGFTEFDRASAQRVAVVSQAMGKKFWPGENPIGQRMHFYDNRDGDPNWYTVVGIAGDILDDGLDNEPVAAAYLPYAQLAFTLRTMDLAVRTHTSPLNVAGAVRGKVLALDNSLPVFDLTTMENTLADTLAQRRLNPHGAGRANRRCPQNDFPAGDGPYPCRNSHRTGSGPGADSLPRKPAFWRHLPRPGDVICRAFAADGGGFPGLLCAGTAGYTGGPHGGPPIRVKFLLTFFLTGRLIIPRVTRYERRTT
jgi:putative ABC transport system permease protein